jgi:hypothetical protein
VRSCAAAAAAVAPFPAPCGGDDVSFAVEAPTETPTIRIPKETLTQAEGFTDAQYVTAAVGLVARGAIRTIEMAWTLTACAPHPECGSFRPCGPQAMTDAAISRGTNSRRP